jgi:hypothetical protein
MLQSAKGQETGKICTGHPRRNAFGMLEFGFRQKRAITSTIHKSMQSNPLPESGDPREDQHHPTNKTTEYPFPCGRPLE